jgi:uncharacterized protein YoaH (UPF0181 family)
VIEIDVTMALGVLSAVATAVGGVVGALWRASQKAQREVVAQLQAELGVERGENLRLHVRIAELYEQRHAETQKAVREMLEFMAASRRANEEAAKTLDALKALLERKLT